MRPPRSPQPLGRRVTDLLPGWLRRHLAVVLGEQGAPLYLAGGVVRDLLRGVAAAAPWWFWGGTRTRPGWSAGG